MNLLGLWLNVFRVREGGRNISYLHSLPFIIIFGLQKMNWLTELSDYFTGNRADDAACDEEDEY